VTPTKRCLDGETLAAWVDGGLSRSDATMAEAHVSSCPRCQEIAGLIVKTTPPTTVAPPWWRARAAWLVPATVGVTAVGLWIVAPTSPAPSPRPPAAIAPLEPMRDAAVPAAPAVAPPVAERQPVPVPQQADQRKDLKREKKSDDVQARATTAANAAAAPAEPPAAPPPAAASERLAARQGAREESAKAGAKAAVSPDGALHWRITDRGAVERSTDRGATWEAVNVGIAATFSTVQAPEPRVALVTTTDGRVFRTSDGGATWQLVAPKL
jgi:hypothetical protein